MRCANGSALRLKCKLLYFILPAPITGMAQLRCFVSSINIFAPQAKIKLLAVRSRECRRIEGQASNNFHPVAWDISSPLCGMKCNFSLNFKGIVLKVKASILVFTLKP